MTAMKMLLIGMLALMLAFMFANLKGCSEDAAAEDETTTTEDAAAEEETTTTTTTEDPNPCAGTKPTSAEWENGDCVDDDGITVLVKEQSGSNVTKGYTGDLPTDATPILTNYSEAGLCAVNVHWHLGAEHLSAGEFDLEGKGPNNTAEEDKDGEGDSRRLAAKARLGLRCHYYDEADSKFTTEYNWEHCEGMHVGETYEVHWPHSAGGDCGTEWQYQTPFYDGVFCNAAKLVPSTHEAIGVEGQVFTIVNDENNVYDDLFYGAWKDGTTHWEDVAYYTGSTTGTSRDNSKCSKYAPITWQVDRKCHLISASSFDKMCKKMKEQSDDMHSDLHAHGARELVIDMLAADNHQRL